MRLLTNPQLKNSIEKVLRQYDEPTIKLDYDNLYGDVNCTIWDNGEIIQDIMVIEFDEENGERELEKIKKYLEKHFKKYM